MDANCTPITVPVDNPPCVKAGDHILVSGKVLCGRDAVLPKVCALIENGSLGKIDADFSGAAVFHTAVSCAGVGPTSSNKLEIEESFGPLCEAGVKLFLGKGALKPETVAKMAEHGAAFVVVPPATALLEKGMKSKRCVAFPELGMEALYEIELEDCPAVVAAAGGDSLFG